MKNPRFNTTVNSWLLITACSLFGAPALTSINSRKVDGGDRKGVFPHFWSECAGTGTIV